MDKIVNNNNYIFRIIWGKENIGLAVDRKVPDNLISPVTSFFFWPRENGWALLKEELSNKPWMAKEDQIEILNGYSDLINYWLENAKKIEGIKKLVRDSKKLNFELISTM